VAGAVDRTELAATKLMLEISLDRGLPPDEAATWPARVKPDSGTS
jgi:hypothetical protein